MASLEAMYMHGSNLDRPPLEVLLLISTDQLLLKLIIYLPERMLENLIVGSQA